MFSKMIIVFDDDVDVHNLSEVIWRLSNNIDPARDVQIVKGPVDSLNHAAPLVGFGSKIGIDATKKWPSEGHTREWPDVVKMDARTVAKVDEMWANLGLGENPGSPSAKRSYCGADAVKFVVNCVHGEREEFQVTPFFRRGHFWGDIGNLAGLGADFLGLRCFRRHYGADCHRGFRNFES